MANFYYGDDPDPMPFTPESYIAKDGNIVIPLDGPKDNPRSYVSLSPLETRDLIESLSDQLQGVANQLNDFVDSRR